MRTTDDLREELAGRAEALPDSPAASRLAAVRGRVRTARRRRTAGGAVAAAVVLAGGALTVHGLRSPEPVAPADGTVAGIDVPSTVDVLGFGYRLADASPVGNRETVSLPDGPERAVVLAGSDLGGGSATLYVDDVAVARVRGEEQTTPPVPVTGPHADLEVVLDNTGGDARAGIAVYEPDGSLAPGVQDASGSAVFRDQYAGNPLLAAGFSEPGASEVQVTPSGSLADTRFVQWCQGDPDLWVNIDIDGQPAVSGPCGDETRDAAAGSSAGFTTAPRPGDGTHQVRAFLTRGDDGPEVPAGSGTTFGVGVYRRAVAAEPVLGSEVEHQVEYQGRTWTLDRVGSAPARIDTASGDRLVLLKGLGGKITATWSGTLSQGTTTGMGAGDTASTITLGLLLAGDTYDVTTRGGETRLLVYRPVDEPGS